MFSGVGKQMVNAEFSRIYRFVKLLVNEGFLAVNLPRLQQTKSPHQNQRVYCLTCRGGFLCWFECYSFSVFMRLYKHLPLASTLALLGEFYKVAV